MEVSQMPVQTNDPGVVKQGRKFFSKLGLMYFLGTLIIIGIQLSVTVLIQVFAPSILENPNWSMVISMVPMYLIGMPIMILLIRTVPKEKIEPKSISVGKLVLAMIMSYAIVYCSNLVGTVITFIIGILKGSAVNNVIQDVVVNINPWLSVLFVVICAPIMEEIIFRKLLIDRAVRYGEGVAVFLSGLLFGLFHGNLSQFVYAFTLGLFFGLVYVKTGKIIYSILLHMVVNFIGSVLSLFVLNLVDLDSLQVILDGGDMAAMSTALPGLMAFAIYFICLIGVVIAGVVLLIVFRKKLRLSPRGIALPRGKRFTTTILNVGMGLFGIFWIVMIILQLIG